MPFTEDGRWASTVITEDGGRVFGAVTEDGGRVFGAAVGAATVAVPTAAEAETPGTVQAFQPFVAPTGLVATGVSDTQVDLTWNAVAGASGYDVERDGIIVVHGHATTAFSDTGLAPASGHQYRVRAVR